MTRPSYRALNQPRLLFGVPHTLLGGSFLGAAVVFDVSANLYAGILVGGLLYLLSRWATAIDSRIDRVFWKAMRVKPYYDSLHLSPERFTDGSTH